MPQALQILIPGGNPNGMKIIELNGWSGKCFIVPRQSLKELKDRPEVNQPGIYLLFGQDEESINDLVYIGESENFYSRIASHDSGKDFWNVAVVFTSGLNRAFVKYLEYKSTLLAQKAKRMIVTNKVNPQENTLSEFEKVAVDQYFDNMEFILRTFDYELFDNAEKSLANGQAYYLKGMGASAEAQLLDNGHLNVRQGSLARMQESKSFGGWSLGARIRFLDDGTFKEFGDGKSYVFTKDVIFKSPSAAAATILGRSANGWTKWKDSAGNSLDDNIRK